MHAWQCGLCLLLSVLGCGVQEGGEATRSDGGVDRQTQNATEPPAAGEEVGPPGSSAAVPAPANRKIIYNATVHLVVKDFTAVETQIPQLAGRFGGYLAGASVDRTRGAWLSGRWVVRVPVGRYGEFLAAVAELGIAERREETAQDVTEEFVDLEARIANKRRLEERIVELLESKSGKIADVIEVERELARVREEIERMQGRLKYLSDRTTLATVTIHAREERDYVPPQAPTFGGQVASVWSASIETMLNVGRFLTLTAVAVAPWLAVLALLVVPLAWALRRRYLARVVR